MGYATAGSEAQVNEYLVLRLQQQTDLPISMPTSSAAFATLQIVVANFLFQSGMSLHITCTFCSPPQLWLQTFCLAAVIEGSCKSICTFCYSAIEVYKQFAITAVEGVCLECYKTLMQQQFCKDQNNKAFVSKALEQHSTYSDLPHKVTSNLDSWLRLHVDCRFWVDIGTAGACLGSRYIAPCSEEKHQVHNSSFVGNGFSLFCTFSSHKKEEEL